jgi:toxin-antitoxin system PIN domain toxin
MSFSPISTEVYIPDINVWLALLHHDHPARPAAMDWWESAKWQRAYFVRQTQLGLLRLLTMSIVMNGKPLTMAKAWAAYEAVFQDDRVSFLPEPERIQERFRHHTSIPMVSPMLWADRWLVAFAEVSGAILLTCDKALAKESKSVKLLVSSK